MTSNISAQYPPTRLVTIDLLRIISAFGIVCFHSRFEGKNLRELFYAGLVCFIMMSVWFGLERENRSARQHFNGMARILIPWLFWSLVFAIKDYALNNPFRMDAMLPLRIGAGTALHLWYVMFLVTVLTMIWWGRSRLTLATLNRASWVGLVALTLSAESWRMWSMAMPAPFPQYAHAFFPVLAGIVLYCDFQRNLFAGTALTMLAALYLAQFHGVGIPYLIGISLCVAAFGLAEKVSSPSTAWSTLADCMYGVYLIHPLLYYPWRRLISEQSLAYPVCVFGTASVIVLLARFQNNALVHLLFGVRPRTP